MLGKEQFQADVDYTTLEMSLRLVSRFLALDSVVRHIVVMTDGEERVHDDQNGRHMARHSGPKKHPQDNSLVLTSCSSNYHSGDDNDHYYHWRANEILQQATEHIHFCVNDSDTMPVMGGSTKHIEGPFTSAQAARLSVSGVGSHISIGSVYYRHLSKLAPRVKSGETLNEPQKAWRLCTQFELARLIVHELSHALENLYTGWRRRECFCESNTLSERGFDCEAAIFGGLLDINWSRQLLESRRGEYCLTSQRRIAQIPCVVFYPWPNQTYADMYCWRKQKMGIMQTSTTPSATMASRVPLSSIEALFTNKYWDEVSSSGQSSLVVPCVQPAWWVRFFRSSSRAGEAIHPWLSKEEVTVGKAANQGKYQD